MYQWANIFLIWWHQMAWSLLLKVTCLSISLLIIKILNLCNILLCTHLYHFFRVLFWDIQIQDPLAQLLYVSCSRNSDPRSTSSVKLVFLQRIWKFKIWKNKNIARNYSKSKNEDFWKFKNSEKVLKNKVVLKLKIK